MVVDAAQQALGVQKHVRRLRVCVLGTGEHAVGSGQADICKRLQQVQVQLLDLLSTRGRHTTVRRGACAPGITPTRDS